MPTTVLVSANAEDSVVAYAAAVLLLKDAVASEAGPKDQKEIIVKEDSGESQGAAALEKVLSQVSANDEDKKWTGGPYDAQFLARLNKTLEDRVYLLSGLTPTLADAVVFGRIRNQIKNMKHAERCSNANVTRWFHHIQSQTDAAVLPYVTIKLSYEEPKKEEKKQGASDKGAAGKKESNRRPSAKTAQSVGPHNLQIVAGKILEIIDHPKADRLYVEKIDIGQAEPITVVSGLREHITKEEMQGRMVAVVLNLKPAKMVEINSTGLVLCASDESHSKVEVLTVPEGTGVGERFLLENANNDEEPKQIAPKNWSKISKTLTTDADGVACGDGARFKSSAGYLGCKTLPNALVR